MLTLARLRTLGLLLPSLVVGSIAHAHAEGDDNSLVFGQTAALSGPTDALGKGMRLGLEAAFAEINKTGGVHGRKLSLISLDDGYEPDRAAANTKALLEINKVFALIGGVGTPTTKASEVLAEAEQVPIIGAFTGAQFLYEADNTHIVNIRASYNDEAEQWVQHLTEDLGAKRISVLYQGDAFGTAVRDGLKIALGKRNMAPVSEGTYERNTIAVKQAALDIQQGNPDAIVIVAPYRPAAEFIRTARALGLRVPMISSSFVAGDVLGKELGAQGAGIYITQVMPPVDNASLPIVRDYRAALAAYDAEAKPGLISLEGYVAGRMAIRTLQKIQGDITREAFIKTVQQMHDEDLGGLKLSYSVGDNKGLDQVYLTRLKADGTYENMEHMVK